MVRDVQVTVGLLAERQVRCHKASALAKPTFHSLDTRPEDQGGAVFALGEPLVWFDY